MFNLDAIIRKMLWRIISPCACDPVKPEIVYRRPNERIVIELSPIDCSGVSSGSTTLKMYVDTQTKHTMIDKIHCIHIPANVLNNGTNSNVDFDSIVFSLIFLVRQMCDRYLEQTNER